MILRTFGWSFGVTVASLVVAFIYGSWEAFLLCVILGVLEVSLSFDNAVVNAKVLERMSEFWQKIFLTIGILIAVFGMRLVFPLLIVGITANLGPLEAVDLALEGGEIDEPGTYAYLLDQAHPLIASFGGMFLLMLFLDWLFEERDITWLSWLERPLARIGKLDALAVIVAAVALVLAAEFLAAEDERASVLMSGLLGLITYLAVNGLGNLFESSGIADEGTTEDGDETPRLPAGSIEGGGVATTTRSGPTQLAKATGKAGFFLFLYLEVLDASFSFDGVIGAFAITSDPIIIALGLGFIGAMFVRSITVYLVRQGTLAEYVYLEHGAHWAIGALAAILLLSLEWHIPELITGLIGVVFIGAAFINSLIRRRRGDVHDVHVGETAEPERV
ncbi:DUF475 domain-containing protein [Trujillonella endophytica]|uniref:Integral membrane protein, YkoY family n=1 Tax=Trujillonella endophytica TaxID=673521 RepID=A0A1H8PII5_9ACTN|nr:DUF475 domain-containing protein [Trujillella endophytica]SEO41581.1 hypothetical protein SAMN05660991_00195 [Trujillella endophytica]